MTYAIIGAVIGIAAAIFLLVRWFIKRAPLRQARRACRKGDKEACKRYEELRRK
jgi:hypothetical protein